MVVEQRSKASVAMDAYAEGDVSAFPVVYDELSVRLYAYLTRLTGSRVTSQDIVQQVFLNMHQARSTFQRGARVEPWAYAIARRLAVDWSRRIRKEPWLETVQRALEGPDNCPERMAVGRQLEQCFHRELTTIPVRLRESFLLTRIEGLSTAEAALVLGTSPANVKVRAHRAGLLLREKLGRLSFGRGSE